MRRSIVLGISLVCGIVLGTLCVNMQARADTHPTTSGKRCPTACGGHLCGGIRGCKCVQGVCEQKGPRDSEVEVVDPNAP